MANEYPKCMSCGNPIVPPDVRVTVYRSAQDIEGFVHVVCTRKIEEAAPVSQEAFNSLRPKPEYRKEIQGSWTTMCPECGTTLTGKNRVDIKEFETLCYTCYSKKPKHICVGFDGVLAEYDGWKGPEYLGPPRDGSREFLAALKSMGCKVVIFTTRRTGAIQVWLREHDLWHLVSAVTNEKGPALCYVDDRAVTFRGSFSDALTDIKGFVPYWRGGKA